MKMLDPAKNPLWLAGNPYRFWTVHRGGKPVGRIIAHMHRAIERTLGLEPRAVRVLRLRR